MVPLDQAPTYEIFLQQPKQFGVGDSDSKPEVSVRKRETTQIWNCSDKFEPHFEPIVKEFPDMSGSELKKVLTERILFSTATTFEPHKAKRIVKIKLESDNTAHIVPLQTRKKNLSRKIQFHDQVAPRFGWKPIRTKFKS